MFDFNSFEFKPKPKSKAQVDWEVIENFLLDNLRFSDRLSEEFAKRYNLIPRGLAMNHAMSGPAATQGATGQTSMVSEATPTLSNDHEVPVSAQADNSGKPDGMDAQASEVLATVDHFMSSPASVEQEEQPDEVDDISEMSDETVESYDYEYIGYDYAVDAEQAVNLSGQIKSLMGAQGHVTEVMAKKCETEKAPRLERVYLMLNGSQFDELAETLHSIRAYKGEYVFIAGAGPTIRKMIDKEGHQVPVHIITQFSWVAEPWCVC